VTRVRTLVLSQLIQRKLSLLFHLAQEAAKHQARSSSAPGARCEVSPPWRRAHAKPEGWVGWKNRLSPSGATHVVKGISSRVYLGPIIGYMAKELIFELIKTAIQPGTSLPGTKYIVKGLGERHGELALIYRIPNNTAPGKHYEKGIAKSEWEQAFQRLRATGEFSRQWFNINMSACAKSGPCQFLAIGAGFVLLAMAEKRRGAFVLRK